MKTNTDAIDVVKLRAGIQNDCEEFFADNTDFIRDVVGDELFDELFEELEESFE